MAGQRFAARVPFRFANDAIGYGPGGPFDCLGPFAKVVNCPIGDTDLRRTCYATAYADTFFSVPAVTTIFGTRVIGFLTTDAGADGRAIKFVPVRY